MQNDHPKKATEPENSSNNSLSDKNGKLLKKKNTSSFVIERKSSKLKEDEDNANKQDEGEWVERNGESVMRVRKRKRRSRQKKHEVQDEESKKTKQIVLILSSLFILSLIVCLLTFLRVNSSSFRAQIESTLQQEAGGAWDINGFHSSFFKISAASVLKLKDEKDFLQEMRLEDLSGDHYLYGFFGGKWKGEEILAQSGKLVLNLDAAPFSGKKEGLPYDFKSFRCDAMDIKIKAPHSIAELQDAEVVKRYQQYHISNSTLQHPWLKKWQLKLLEFDSSNQQCSVQLEKNKITTSTLSGSINRTTGLQLKGAIKQLDLKDLNPKIKHLVLARMNLNDATIKGKLDNIIVEGAFTSDFLHLNFEGLDLLQQLLQIDSKMITSGSVKAKGQIFAREDFVRLHDLALDYGNLFQIKGELTLQKQLVTGELQFGVKKANAILMRENKKLLSLFENEKEGRIWATIKIGGTIENPRDNVQARLNKSVDINETPETETHLQSQLERLLQQQ